jgi:N-acetylmuramoyl-L-alanine amidase
MKTKNTETGYISNHEEKRLWTSEEELFRLSTISSGVLDHIYPSL